jgi:hypothetical protein
MSGEKVGGDDLEAFQDHLAQTIAWVTKQLDLRDPAKSLRSDVTRPPYFADREETVKWLSLLRLDALDEPGLQPTTNLAGGRLFAFMPDDTLFDGASEVATQGFFDFYNVPPWDTWVAYVRGAGRDASYANYLICWVPASLVELVEHGIAVNPEACISWIEEVESPSLVLDLALRLSRSPRR